MVGDSRADRRLQCGAAGPAPATGLPDWPGLGRTSAQRRPRPAPGMRSPARTQREPRPPWRVRQAGPLGSASPSGPGPPQPPARQSHASADGHRSPALTATSTAGSPMLLGLRPAAAAAASASAHLPAVGQRRHQPTRARGNGGWGGEWGQRARTHRQARQCRKSERVYGRAVLGHGFPQLCGQLRALGVA